MILREIVFTSRFVVIYLIINLNIAVRCFNDVTPSSVLDAGTHEEFVYFLSHGRFCI